MKRKITLNMAQCRICKDVLISRDTDSVMPRCSCGNLKIGGGTKEMIRVVKHNPIRELSVYEDVE